MLTIGNLFLGVMAILLAFQNGYQYVEYAAILVIIGMVFDGLDGKMARLLNAQSEFGKQLDSLSDLVTFGVAPAFIIYAAALQELGILGIASVGLFPICGALRLARFNIQSSGNTGYFIGLPITAAGGALATLALYNNLFSPVYLVISMLILAYLMISRVKYPNFKKVGIPRASIWVVPFLIVVVAIFGYMFPTQFPKIVSIPLAIYALYGIKKSFDHLWKKDARRVEDEEHAFHDSTL